MTSSLEMEIAYSYFSTS